MKTTRVALGVAALVMATSGSLDAQARGRFTMPSKPPRQAVQPRSDERPQPATPPRRDPYGYGPHAAVPVAYTLLPAVIMSDGRVFADFGYGYEPVSRPCAAVAPIGVTYSSTPASSGIPVVAGNGIVLSPVPTIQPAPQMTPSPRSGLQSAATTHSVSQSATRQGRGARDACFRHEPAGGVVVVW